MSKKSSKLLRESINSIGTIVGGYMLGGMGGLVTSLIPDIGLVSIVSDVYKGKDKDRLVGIYEKVHNFTHSISPIILTGIASIYDIIPEYVPFVLSLHIGLDYLTHKKSDNEFFKGYYPFYPSRKIHIGGER